MSLLRRLSDWRRARHLRRLERQYSWTYRSWQALAKAEPVKKPHMNLLQFRQADETRRVNAA